jgi:hypothetical protein
MKQLNALRADVVAYTDLSRSSMPTRRMPAQFFISLVDQRRSVVTN